MHCYPEFVTTRGSCMLKRKCPNQLDQHCAGRATLISLWCVSFHHLSESFVVDSPKPTLKTDLFTDIFYLLQVFNDRCSSQWNHLYYLVLEFAIRRWNITEYRELLVNWSQCAENGMLLKITPSNLLNISCRYQSNLIVYLCYEYFNQGCQLEGCHTLTNAIDLGILTCSFLFFPMQIDCSMLLYLKAEFIFPSVPVYLGKPSRCLIFTKTRAEALRHWQSTNHIKLNNPRWNKPEQWTDERGTDSCEWGQARQCGNFSVCVCVCVYQLAVEEERQENAQLLSLVQKMILRILLVCSEKSRCLTLMVGNSGGVLSWWLPKM